LLETKLITEGEPQVKKYVALDVDSANIVAGVYDSRGKCLMLTHLRNEAKVIREYFKGLSGTVHVTFEEGTQAAWLYELIEPLVAAVVVCDPRQNKLLKAGNKSDHIDVAKLARLLRLGELRSVYQGPRLSQGLKQLVHSYDALVDDSRRTKNRLKALYRGRGLSCKGEAVYGRVQREQWLTKLPTKEMQTRAVSLFGQLDHVEQLSSQAEKTMCQAARKHDGYKWISSVPGIGAIRTAQILATAVTPNRFRGKRQFWPYCGLAVVTRTSSDYEWIDGRTRRKRKPIQTRGLNQNHNRTMKAVFKGAAASAVQQHAEVKEYYERLCAKGMRPEMAQLTVARKLAAIVLILWKKGELYDPQRLNQAAPGAGQQ
jgi:transposase